MAQIYQNFISGTLSAGITDVETSIAGSALASLAVVSTPDTVWICLDPDGSAGAPEIVTVTTHTSSATTATVTRGAQSTTARAHLINTVWRVAVTKADLDELPFRKMTTTGDILYASAANTASRLAAGSTGVPLTIVGGVPSWTAVTAAGIGTDAVTTAKIDALAVTAAELAADAVTTVKILDGNVTADKLGTDAVTTDKINALAVTAAELAADAVTTTKILDANVTYAKQAFTKCRLSKSTTLTASFADITGWTEDDDASGFYSSGANAVVPSGGAGIYSVGLLVDCEDTSASVRAVVYLNGVAVAPSYGSETGAQSTTNGVIAMTVYLADADTVKVQAKCDAGDTAKTQVLKLILVRIA